MQDLLIIKNITREGPGLLEDILKNEGITSTVVDLDQGEPFPDPTGYKAVVVFGGPDSANDTTPKMTTELTQIQKVLAAKIPFLGICLGMQALVKAAGGQVVPAPQKEVGFTDALGVQYTIDLTEQGQDDPLLDGLDDSVPVFHLHGETVELTPGMQLLGTGKYCTNQIIKVSDTAYGIQSHFELTEDMLETWATNDPDLIPLGSTPLLASYLAIRDAYNEVGQTILTNFLEIAGLI